MRKGSLFPAGGMGKGLLYRDRYVKGVPLKELKGRIPFRGKVYERLLILILSM